MRSLKSILDLMLRLGWRPNVPALPRDIELIERRFDVSLPEDYREFLRFSNGGGRSASTSFRGLMRIEELILFNHSYRVQRTFPGLVAFANEGFLVYAFDFRADPTVVASVGLSSSDWDDVVTEAGSFTEWLEAGIKMP